MRRVVGPPSWRRFFLIKKNDRCWCVESKYLKHPKRQENISKICSWNIMCICIYVYISCDHDAWARQLSNIIKPPLGFSTKKHVVIFSGFTFFRSVTRPMGTRLDVTSPDAGVASHAVALNHGDDGDDDSWWLGWPKRTTTTIWSKDSSELQMIEFMIPPKKMTVIFSRVFWREFCLMNYQTAANNGFQA